MISEAALPETYRDPNESRLAGSQPGATLPQPFISEGRPKGIRRDATFHAVHL